MMWIGDTEAIRYATRDLSTLDLAVQQMKKRRTAVQAGGNLGVFAKHLSPKFDRVVSFEPHPQIFRKMAINVQESNVVLMQAALGDAPGGVTMSRTRRGAKADLPPHDGITHVSGDGIIPKIRLDDLCLTDVDLLVLDLEGMELSALRGAALTIEACRPVVMIEINGNCRHYGLSEEDVRTALRIEDYKFIHRAHSDEIWVCDRRRAQT